MKPIKVTEAEIVFGGKIEVLLPPIEEIPKEFRDGKSKWNKVFGDWFFYGLKDCKWVAKKDVNVSEALRHLQAVMVSYEPKHEHKESGCAYLLDCFFVDVDYRRVE